MATIPQFCACFLVGVLGCSVGLAQDQAPSSEVGTPQNLLSESAQRLADGDYEGAIRDASLAIQLDPHNVAAYEARGSIYIQEKLWDRAERDYATAAKLSPDAVYKYKLGEIKFLQKAYEDAQPRFVALEGDPALGDLASFKAFLCDLLGGHEAAAHSDLAERDRAQAAPSVYFCHAAWELYHNRRVEAAKYFSELDQLYDHSVNNLYIESLVECRRFQLSSATFTARDGTSYNNASVFLESAGLRVSTEHGWVTLPVEELPDDLSAFPEDLRAQIDRQRAAASSVPAPVSLLSFTTRSGQRFEHVRWTVEESGLSVLTTDGWKELTFSDLPADLSSFPDELQQEIAEKSRGRPARPVDAAVVSFKTKSGKTYREIRASLGRDGLHLVTTDGWITVPFRDLPDDVSCFPADWQPGIQAGRTDAQETATEMQVVTFSTKRGVHYDQVRAAMEKSGLRLITADGLIAVPFNQLPDDLSVFPSEWRETIAARATELSKSQNTGP